MIFFDFLSIHSFTQSVNFPTRDNNILDICSDRPALITTSKALPGISDHNMLFITLLLSVKIYLPVKRKIYLWSTARNEDIQHKAFEKAKTDGVTQKKDGMKRTRHEPEMASLKQCNDDQVDKVSDDHS